MFCRRPYHALIPVAYRWLALCAVIAGMGGAACARQLATEPAIPALAIWPPAELTLPTDTLPVTKRSLVASLRRTPCFGRCPVFSVEVWSDGLILWQGERYVSRQGVYSARVSAAWITDLVQAGEQAGFFELGSRYPSNGRLVPDLPQTITMLRRGRQGHQVTNNADAPLSLLRFEHYWQDKLEALKWKPVAQ